MARPKTKAGVMIGRVDSGPKRRRVGKVLRDSSNANAKPRTVETTPTMTARNRLLRSAPRPRASMTRTTHPAPGSQTPGQADAEAAGAQAADQQCERRRAGSDQQSPADRVVGKLRMAEQKEDRRGQVSGQAGQREVPLDQHAGLEHDAQG